MPRPRPPALASVRRTCTRCAAAVLAGLAARTLMWGQSAVGAFSWSYMDSACIAVTYAATALVRACDLFRADCVPTPRSTAASITTQNLAPTLAMRGTRAMEAPSYRTANSEMSWSPSGSNRPGQGVKGDCGSVLLPGVDRAHSSAIRAWEATDAGTGPTRASRPGQSGECFLFRGDVVGGGGVTTSASAYHRGATGPLHIGQGTSFQALCENARWPRRACGHACASQG